MYKMPEQTNPSVEERLSNIEAMLAKLLVSAETAKSLAPAPAKKKAPVKTWTVTITEDYKDDEEETVYTVRRGKAHLAMRYALEQHTGESMSTFASEVVGDTYKYGNILVRVSSNE